MFAWELGSNMNNSNNVRRTALPGSTSALAGFLVGVGLLRRHYI